MKKSIAALDNTVDLVLIDGNTKIPNLDINQINIIGGDNLCYNIAAASILAKEARDEMMRQAGEVYPGYGFEKHVGYGTKVHMEALKELGVSSNPQKKLRTCKETALNSYKETEARAPENI